MWLAVPGSIASTRPPIFSPNEMKPFICIFLAMLTLASFAFGREQSVLARVTVYWARGGGGSDVWTRQHRCATGAHLRAGHCAVDPKKISYGSKVVFEDTTCIAVDTGRDVVNRKAARRCGRNSAERSALVIDRFFETKSQALHWANTHPQFMTVRVLSPSEQLAESRKTRYIAKQTAPVNRIPRLLRIARSEQLVLARNIQAASTNAGPKLIRIERPDQLSAGRKSRRCRTGSSSEKQALRRED